MSDGFGYAAQFPRVLRRFALFAVAFSIVSITTGIFLNYSYGLTQMGPAAVWLWPVATIGQFLVVLVLAELAGHFPLAGANYQWSARLVGSRFGYLVGALGVLYGAVGLPGSRCSGWPRSPPPSWAWTPRTPGCCCSSRYWRWSSPT